MDRLLDVLAPLVALDTTTRSSNLPLIDWVEERVAGLADATWRVPSDDGTKANLVARFGPDRPGGVVLSAHTDCVPVDGQDWTSDPFTLTRDGDRVRGRGTCDMKGFIACCVDAADELAAADLRRPVWLALSYDEEIGALGAAPLAAAMADAGVDPEAVIVGEPTSLQIVNAHKGVRAFTMIITGRGGHSSRPDEGANALFAATKVAAKIREVADRVATHGDPAFDPPHTTFNLATMHAGTAINIIPDRAELTYEYRPLPADDGPALAEEIEAFARTEVLPQLQRTAPEATVEVAPIGGLPALHPEVDGAAERLVRDLLGTTAPARSAPFGTDASRFQHVGWSTVVCGPGSIDVAHRPDEYVPLDDLARCRRLLSDLAGRLAR